MTTNIRRTIAALAVLALASLACAADQTLTLRLGQSKKLEGGKGLVKFAAVVSDSRCPEGVTCIAAGDAVISLEIGKAGALVAKELRLNSDPRKVEFEGGALSIASLTPKAPKGETDYVVELSFSR